VRNLCSAQHRETIAGLSVKHDSDQAICFAKSFLGSLRLTEIRSHSDSLDAANAQHRRSQFQSEAGIAAGTCCKTLEVVPRHIDNFLPHLSAARNTEQVSLDIEELVGQAAHFVEAAFSDSSSPLCDDETGSQKYYGEDYR
jgi:hypothetical protein